MPNILVATLGTTWQVIPELLGYTNRRSLPLYSAVDRPSDSGDSLAGIGPVDELWLVTTDSDQGRKATENLVQWHGCWGRLKLRIWSPTGIADITSPVESRQMADLIYRLVVHAHHRASREGQVLLSLAGGRKTMSAELQQAGRVFGCSAMLHIVDALPAGDKSPERQTFQSLAPRDWTRPLPVEIAGCFHPIVVAGRIEPLEGASDIEALHHEFPLEIPAAPGVLRSPPGERLYNEVHRRLKGASQLYQNYRRLHLDRRHAAGSFRALYMLPSRIVAGLQSERIGVDPDRREVDLRWLRALPKAELHCHFGGILAPSQMIRVARSVEDRVAAYRSGDGTFDRELGEIETAVAEGDLERLEARLGIVPTQTKELRRRWKCPEPLGVAGFLLAFRRAPALLDRWLFGEHVDPARFRQVGFPVYERLGDLQGSGLLRCRETIREAMAVLGEQCAADNITYLELRCSPMKYAHEGLSGEEVVREMLDGAERIEGCDVRLMFIASRHGEPAQITGHVELAVRLLEEDERFAQRFAGFDLAGDEQVCEPAALRREFAPLREEVIRITIHAGEGTTVENIWQAVYELSADRIGHGLSLGQDPRLADRFRDRSIAVELCPSSNDQILGYRDRLLPDGAGFQCYPLADYLQRGLRVTINTDNPGISRTTLSHEYFKAAAMMEGGLSKWQVLQLIRNGFRSAFCDFETRRKMLIDAERRVMEIVSAGD